MIFAVAILLFFAVLIWDLISDYEKWLKERKVNHAKEGWLRATLLLIPTLILISAHPNKTLWPVVYTLLLEGFWYWFLFDGIYNRIRGFDFWYTGTNDKDDAKTDNFLQSMPPWVHKVIKITAVIVATWLYIK